MTGKLISLWYAAALALAGISWASQQPSWAADQSLAGQLSPIPVAAPVLPPRPGAPAPAPNVVPPATSPTAENIPSPVGTTTPTPTDCQPTEQDECAVLGGAAFSGPPGKYWIRTDYLAWWTSGIRLPPLVTTSSNGVGTGALGDSDTIVAFGGNTVGDDMRSGFRTVLGMWLGMCHTWSIEFDYLSLGEREFTYDQFSNGSQVLARPYFDASINAQSSSLVAYPGADQGTISADVWTYFQGAGVTVSRSLFCCNSCGSCDGDEQGCAGACCCMPMLCGCRTDLLIGFRYYNLSDSITIADSVTDLAVVPGTVTNVTDSFRTQNDFYGSEIGLRTRMYRGRCSLELLTKLAMGNTHQTISIGGQTDITPPGTATTSYGAGLLAGPPGTNSGVYQRDEFTIVPQLGLELGYQVSCQWRAYFGYDLLYWGSVARAGDQIDPNLIIDSRNIPPSSGGLPLPQATQKTDSFWAQGLHLGLERRF